MRPLKEEEENKVLRKLKLFLGDSVSELLTVYKLQYNNQKVLLVTDEILKATAQIKRDEIMAAGIILGKFTKTEQFRITITALHVLHKYALNKVWLKASAEMNFLYGNNALRSHVQKVSENIPMNGGVFVFNHHSTPLGFGVMAISPTSYSKARGGDIAVLVQGDCGEYIRSETNLA